MKRIIPLVLILVLLLTLTACFPIGPGGNTDPTDDPKTEGDTFDPIYVANNIAPVAVTRSIRVEASFKSLLSGVTQQGSGVIYHVGKGDRCYALTNAHVVTPKDDYVYSELKVTDAYGDVHMAQVAATDPERDLAVITFVSSKTLEAAPIMTANPSRGDFVFSVGNPAGVTNIVTYGNVGSYVNLDDDDIAFPVINHSASTDNGSSGGGLFDKDGNVVGINYAGGENTETGKKYFFAIPAEKIREFLIANNLHPEAFE